MCDLYSITTNQAAIIALFRVVNRYVGNLPPMPGVFPDYPAPVIRNAGDGREMTLMRWACRRRRCAWAARPSPTSATRHRRTGADGSSLRTAAWCHSTASRNAHSAEPQDEEERRRMVRARRRSPVDGVRWYLDRVQG